MSATPTLKKALNQRQLTMIAIGGVIGAGLFVGSGVVIGGTGPGAFLTYGMAGVLIIMVMRMLAEMAVANPSTGSFADYSRNALGHWAGFSVGWLYWYFWVIVVGFEAIAGAKIIQYWIDVPLWLSALVFMILMTATNLFSVASYGEFEFWFAGIKVAAIIAFIALGGAYVFGLWPGKSADFSNLTSHGGFTPLGLGAITVGIVTVIFSMVGAEIATIAAAESSDPERAVAKAANSVILRILIFYVGAVFLLVTILPWNDDAVSASPFVAAFTKMGIPYADHVMNAVVLTAVLSCLNSGMYTASRMLFVLAARREAPPALVKVTRRGVPANAILASSVIGFLCVIAAALSPDTIFAFLLNSSGAIILFVYLLIAISQIVLRYRTPDSELRVKMWLFPVLSILTALGIVAILVQMFIDKALRSQLVLSLLSWAVVILLFAANKWFVNKRPLEPVETPTAAPHRVLVLANQTLDSHELLAELSRIGADRDARYLVVVPASPVDTGAAATHGPRDVTEATQEAAQARLDATLSALRSENLDAEGELGDYRPLRALDHAVETFDPDQIVIATLPPELSIWQRFDVVDRARSQFKVPVTHVVAKSAVGNQVPR
ncbi:amino acid permease [Mycolicibacterium chubuense]|uniref:GABA permease n=1 Tax=Mycolicibacterium chubuense TaxID=1800 RepID=A0A0J6VS49_MYCCU|nr:amino acid permease [Mycolicibacterium chubuense]KMO73865.1 GABA permease [Mycolicibacterium chubuense]ORA48213.1 amino acid permease [Mycolicibacterium chubuense]SPX97667.1 gamma-aminobutyrate permease-like transporter [Mycolicibacterium chubuense]